VTAYLCAAAVCVAASAVGLAICGRDGSWCWTAPAVGFAALTLLALLAVRLPGHGATAAVAIGAATVAAVVVVLLRGAVDLRPLLEAVPVAAVVIAICSVAFIANDRIGELGAWINDDLSVHMAQADALRTGDAHVLSSGYPNGPHALAAALDAGLGADPSAAFTALLLAVPALTALTALAALEGFAWYLRLPAAVLTGIPYLQASYFAQGAFKEPMLALLFLGFLLTLRDWRRHPVPDVRRVLALALTTAGGVAVFGVVALLWPAAALVWLAVLEPAARRRVAMRRWRLSRARAALIGAAAVALAAALAAGAWGFFDEGPGRYIGEDDPGGNFIGQLNPLEALGVWRQPDFRTAIPDPLLQPGILLACAVVTFGLVWCWRRRERVLLAGALAGISVYVVARPVTLAYFSGKALTIAAVPLTLVAVKALVATASSSRASGRRWLVVAATVVLGAYVAVAGSSSALALRAAHVRPSERGPDLAAFRPLVKGQLTIYLGRDNFAPWELRGAVLRGFQSYETPLGTGIDDLPRKSATDSRPPAVDADSVDPFLLAFARFLITPRTPYASRPPANYRPIRRTRWHVLWERRGPTLPRRILAEGEAPGKTLDCATPAGRRLAAQRGVAYVRPAPVEARAGAWRVPGGPVRGGSVESGGSREQTLELAPGTWNLSLRYYSDVPLRLRAETLEITLPPYLADESTFASAGRVAWRGGPLTVTVTVPARRRVETVRAARLGTLAATRVDEHGRLVPLAQACGRYVDWYRLASD
jgi:hypothetical protein